MIRRLNYLKFNFRFGSKRRGNLDVEAESLPMPHKRFRPSATAVSTDASSEQQAFQNNLLGASVLANKPVQHALCFSFCCNVVGNLTISFRNKVKANQSIYIFVLSE